MRAYFTEAEPIGDPDTLVRLMTSIGIDEDEARAVLDGDAYADAVRADEQLARADRHPGRAVLRARTAATASPAPSPPTCCSRR